MLIKYNNIIKYYQFDQYTNLVVRLLLLLLLSLLLAFIIKMAQSEGKGIQGNYKLLFQPVWLQCNKSAY